MSYGCGDEDCTNCYGPANYVIVSGDGECERFVDEATALEVAEEYGPDVCVSYEADPRFEAKGLHPWEPYPDPIGTIPGSYLPADEAGWSRDVWFGDEIGGDEAVSLAYTAYYELPLTENRTQSVDASYYVYGQPGDYGVVESWTSYNRIDGEREDSTEETNDEGMAPSFRLYREALSYARSLAMADQRWIFAL